MSLVPISVSHSKLQHIRPADIEGTRRGGRLSSIESLEVLWEFNRSAHHCILSLDALTRHEGFDVVKVKALAADMNRARAAANAYLISVIGTAETAMAFSSTQIGKPQ
jgi:hypothetical protein